jgi:hypothetical protein
MHIEYSVFINNFMFIHLVNIPKKLKYVSPAYNGTRKKPSFESSSSF